MFFSVSLIAYPSFQPTCSYYVSYVMLGTGHMVIFMSVTCPQKIKILILSSFASTLRNFFIAIFICNFTRQITFLRFYSLSCILFLSSFLSLFHCGGNETLFVFFFLFIKWITIPPVS